MTASATEKAAPIPALLPCPFCGGEAILHDVIPLAHGAHVECVDCDARTVSLKTNEEAVEAWNRRADRASQEERIREDEPLPERLRKSYEKGAEDERDRLYASDMVQRPASFGLRAWLAAEGAILPADRARLRGGAS